MKKLFISLVLLLSTFILYSQDDLHLSYESDCRDYFAEYINGETEYKIPSYSGKTMVYVDIITELYFIEVDRDKKWFEAIGQALYFSFMTGKKPGIVLILEMETDFEDGIKKVKETVSDKLFELLKIARFYKISV